MTGVHLLVAVLLVATAFGLWRRRTDGRMRHVDVEMDPPVTGPVGGPGDRPVGGPAGRPRESVGRPVAATDVAGPVVGPVAGREAGPADDSEPLIVDGQPVIVADHPVIPAADALGPAELGESLGERATLVQFSSAFCQPCRATRVVLGEVAAMVDGVTHVEIDAESRLDLVRRLDVTRTPTVLVLDPAGRIRTRATGAPRRADVIAAIGRFA